MFFPQYKKMDVYNPKYYEDPYYVRELSYDVLLPNLRYKEENVFFVSKIPIKIIIDGIIEYKTEFKLENISLTGKIRCIDTDIQCKIIEKEYEDGVQLNLKYKDRSGLYSSDVQKFARAAEAAILGINIMEDNDEISYDSSEENNDVDDEQELNTYKNQLFDHSNN